MRPMPNILLHALLALLSSVESKWFPTSPRVDMNFTDLVEFDGYESEWHHITTSDGYVLSVFRVSTHGPCSAGSKRDSEVSSKTVKSNTTKSGPDGVNKANNRPDTVDNPASINMNDKSSNERVPILFTHGMFMSGDDCVTPGPHNAHCYLYADACYDVWVFNARGSHYSRAHTTLDPDTDAKYWNFTFEEMALRDLPATIDFILKQTKKEHIAFVGHSQGAAILMLLCAKKPEYNDKIKIGFGLSPTTELSHSRFVNVKIEQLLSTLLPWMDETGKHFEVFGYGKFSQRVSRFFCGKTKLSYPFCSALIFSFIGYNEFDIPPEVLPVFFGHLPSGTSVKNYLRWGQIARNGFSEYDYGEEKNLRKYGVKKPPLYDLSKATMKWVLICSANDYIADLKDVDVTAAQLVNAQKCEISDKSVGHLDFIVGKSVAKYIVPIVLTALDENKNVCL